MRNGTKKNRQPDNRNPGHCKETALGIADRRSPSGEAPQSGLKYRMRNARMVLVICGFLLLAVALVFGQTLRHEFVNYDDDLYVCENPQIAGGVTLRGIAWTFTTGHANNWHPLTWISHMVDSQLYGLHAGGHHLTSVLLHATAAILLFLALRRMTGALWPSAFVAAVFAIHPLRVESVAWVAERKDVLSGFFFMLTLWAYVGYAHKPFSPLRYLAVVVLFALGLMSKPMLVTLPFVLLLLDYWPLGRIGRQEKDKTFSLSDLFPRRVVVEKLPLLALAAVSCAVTFFAQGKTVAHLDAVPFSSRIANTLVSYVAYLGNFFHPVGLAVFYPHPGTTLQVWKVIASLLALAGITTAVLAWRRRFPYLFVGWFWYMGMMVPVIGLVQVGLHSMADRYTYLPQIGLCIAVTWGVAEFTASRRHRSRVLGIVSTLVVLVLMGFAWRQTSYWRNSETLWRHALACTTRNYVAHNNLGIALADHGQVDAALAHYQKSLEIRPDFAEAHYNLGAALEGRGQVNAAITHYQEGLEIKPDEVEAHYSLGRALAAIGQADAAIAHYRKALEIKPDDALGHYNLGIALEGRGRIAEAITHYQKALEIKPDFAEAHNNLGSALVRRGLAEAAVAHFQKALEIKADNTEAHNNLGIILAGRGQTATAIMHFRKALEIDPANAKIHTSFGNILARSGLVDEAIAHYRKALEINPDYAKARRDLDLALQQRGGRSSRPGQAR